MARDPAIAALESIAKYAEEGRGAGTGAIGRPLAPDLAERGARAVAQGAATTRRGRAPAPARPPGLELVALPRSAGGARRSPLSDQAASCERSRPQWRRRDSVGSTRQAARAAIAEDELSADGRLKPEALPGVAEVAGDVQPATSPAAPRFAPGWRQRPKCTRRPTPASAGSLRRLPSRGPGCARR